ncbi:MAG TPA: hypothetical protein PLB52_02635 [Candidatus Moranbacteria bacterium]|nr:hypothetical protein [Candidatus Moranbacteria bacterium]
MEKELSLKDSQIFFLYSLFWLGLAGIGFCLALLGFFYVPIIWLLVIFCAFWLFYSKFKNKVSLCPSRELIIIGICIIFISIFFSFLSTPTVFSGRDQGSISEAAIRLSQNHAFEFSTPASQEFFKIYGPGKALNFPGFYYTESGKLITQFPLVYISWLAIFYGIFGLTGFAIANAVLLSLFFLAFYLLSRLFLKTFFALPTILFAITSFSFMWFSKYTLSENMAAPLLWISILALMLFLKNLRELYFAVFLASAFLLAFTRIEGWAFLLIATIVIISDRAAKDYLKEKLLSRLFLPVIVFSLVFILNALKDINFYRELIKALLSGIDIKPQAKLLTDLGDLPLPDLYFEKIFCLYGMIGFLFVGIAAILYFLYKQNFYKLIPFFIISPTFLYLFNSHISHDHPWMLRRFMFSVLPAAIFYCGLLLGEQFEKKEKYKIAIAASAFFTVFLIIGNLPAFSKYLFFSENKNLFQETRLLTENFPDGSLILIDRNATSDGWSMLSGPMSSLFGKNSVYFFNTNDFSKLDLRKFNQAYLVVSDQEVPYYLNSTMGDHLKFLKNYTLNFSKLDSLQDDSLEITTVLPDKKEVSVQGKIFEIEK